MDVTDFEHPQLYKEWLEDQEKIAEPIRRPLLDRISVLQAENERLRLALSHIMVSQRSIGGEFAEFGAAYNIAKRAIAGEGEKGK